MMLSTNLLLAVTLRTLYGLPPARELDPARTALVLVDFQDEFFSGRLHLPEGPAALASARRLLGWARAHGITVVHVRQIAARADAIVFAPGSPTVRPRPELAESAGELVVEKHTGGGFSGTDLDERLRARGIRQLVVAGLMTHLAVATTVADASVRGYGVIVAADATATRDLPGAPRALVQRVALAALADRFAEVLATDDILRLPLTL